MNPYDPSELLALCDGIIEDGEFTYDEIYRLSEWLNEHEQACEHWPGNQLVDSLQQAWADGTITSAEARDISRVVLRVEKESAKHEAGLEFEKARDAAALASRRFDPTHAILPLILFTGHVKSLTEPGVTYDVNLDAPSCTCPDFKANRQKLPLGHLGRCCKHICAAYAQLEPSIGWPGWLRAFIHAGWRPDPAQQWTVAEVNGRLVLISSASHRGWTHVFASDHGPYERYGYNLDEHRWAYDQAPPAPERLERAIAEFCGQHTVFPRFGIDSPGASAALAPRRIVSQSAEEKEELAQWGL